MNETVAVELFARAWNQLDPERIGRLFAETIRYTSQNVLEDLNGRSAVLEYLHGQMETINNAGPEMKVFAEIGRVGARPCVLLAQGGKTQPGLLALLTVEAGVILAVDLCSVAPHPSSAERTGQYPGEAPPPSLSISIEDHNGPALRQSGWLKSLARWLMVLLGGRKTRDGSSVEAADEGGRAFGELVATLDILRDALSRRDGDKAHEAISVTLMQCMDEFGRESVVMEQFFPVLDEIKTRIEAEDYPAASRQTDLFISQIHEVIEIIS